MNEAVAATALVRVQPDDEQCCSSLLKIALAAGTAGAGGCARSARPMDTLPCLPVWQRRRWFCQSRSPRFPQRRPHEFWRPHDLAQWREV